ncbi:MAG: response regulator [Odoribacter sp.]
MQKELLSLVPEYLSLGLIVYDKDGYLKYANSIALKMFGGTMRNVYGLNIFNDPNVTLEDKTKLKSGLDVSFETDYDFDPCRELLFPTIISESRKYFVTKVTIMRDAFGNQQGFLLTCEDISEKKIWERKIIDSCDEIKSTQKELGLVLNAGKLISWNYRIDEKMFYKFNDQFKIIGRWSLEFICGCVHPDEREGFIALMDAIIRKQELLENHIVLRVLYPGDEDYRYYDFLFSTREDKKGCVKVIIFIQRDITEDMKYQQDLIDAKNKAEKSDKLKSAFLANMSHEIRTPLNAIVGFSQLLAEVAEPEEKNEYKQLIEANNEILLKLIGDILDLSKIEAGFIDINRQELNLIQLCDELYQSFKQRIKNPRVTLRLINPYAKCVTNFDKHRFTQIFTNFVTNAIKYTEQGEIVMGYECMPGRVRLYVKDTGIGISDEKKSRIFGRFEKLDDFAQGTGLGLSICKAIADSTGGEVGFKSKVNVGSEFWYIGHTNVEFIEKTQSTEVEKEVEVVESYLPIPTLKIENLNILVAEDNDSNFLLIKKMLNDNRLTRAETGAEVVEIVKDHPFDVVFMDIRMPVMNGLEATALIRKFNHTIPIIALTANAFDADKDAALKAGCNYFMTKPVKKLELIEMLSKFC